MTTTNDMPKTIHQGRNIKRFREMLGLKQDALASELGDDWNQKKVSLLESKETIEPDILEQVAEVLKVPAEAIKNFDEERAINIISNTFHDTQGLINYNPTFKNNNVDKLMQLHEEKIALYEKMLKEKDKMMQKLERLIEGK